MAGLLASGPKFSLMEPTGNSALEHGALTERMHFAASRLRETSRRISDNSAMQSVGLQEIADVSETMANDLAKSLEEIRDAATRAHAARERVDSAGASIEKLVESVEMLASGSRSARETMLELVATLSRIDEIVAFVGEVSHRTNLLALNAAIEAARAGEHGRGFAVVADEVRKLAIRSGQSTKEIGAILSAIRKETIGVAEQMQASARAIDEGLRVAQRARTAIDGVDAAIEQTSSAAASMQAQSATMNEASQRLTENVTSVSVVVEQNAAAASSMQDATRTVLDAITPIEALAATQSHVAERISSASGELRDQVHGIDGRVQELSGRARELDDLIGAFIVGDVAQDGLAVPSEPVRLYAVSGGRA